MPLDPTPATWEAWTRALGVEIHRRRIERGLTQEVVAHLAGMSRTHYQQIERGRWQRGTPANPSLQAVVRVAQALDVEPGRLLPPASGLQWESRD